MQCPPSGDRSVRLKPDTTNDCGYERSHSASCWYTIAARRTSAAWHARASPPVAKTVQTGRPAGIRSPGCGTSRMPRHCRHRHQEPRARVADRDVAAREDDGLADGARAASRLQRDRTPAARRRRTPPRGAEHRETVGALDELHRRDQRGFTSMAYGTPSRATKSMPLTPTTPNSSATARASAARQRRASHRSRTARRRPPRGCCRSTGIPPPRTRARRPAGARRRAAPPDRRPRRTRPTRASRRRTPAGSSRCGRRVPRRHRRTPCPPPDASGFTSQSIGPLRRDVGTRFARDSDRARRARHLGHGAARPRAPRDQHRIAHAPEHRRCVPPQRASRGEHADGARDDSRSSRGTRPRRTRSLRPARAAACAVKARRVARSESACTDGC